MGRRPCCDKVSVNRRIWSAMEDKLLIDYIKLHGHGKWRHLPGKAGLNRCGKSCRLRWLNYLDPDIKRGNITEDEDDLIIRLHKLLGNRWALIAGRLPRRTDNEIKNHWNTNHRKTKEDIDNKHPPPPHEIICETKKPELSNMVIRTKAVKCTKVVMMDPPPQSGPPLVDADLPEMEDFDMSFSEFFDSLKLTSLESSDVCWPAEFSTDIDHDQEAAVNPLNDGVFEEENMVSMLESWLQI